MDSKSKIINSSKLNGNISFERSKSKSKSRINSKRNDKNQDENSNPDSSSSSSSFSSSINDKNKNSFSKNHIDNNNNNDSNESSNTITNSYNNVMNNGIPSYLQISKVDLNLKPPIFSTKSIKTESNSRNISDSNIINDNNSNENNSNFHYSSTRSTINTLQNPIIESNDINDNIIKNSNRNSKNISTVSRNIFNPVIENSNLNYQNIDRIQNNDKNVYKPIVSNHDNLEWKKKAVEVALKSDKNSDYINIKSENNDGDNKFNLDNVNKNNNNKSKNEFECDYPGCNKNFSRKMNLNSHIQSTHEKMKPFKCETCNKLFARHSDRRRHEEAQHNLEQGHGFICGGVQKNGNNWGCGKSFKRKDGLTAHWKSQKAKKKCLKGIINEREIEVKLENSNNFTGPTGNVTGSSK